ncbi:MAG: hypothetical protein WC757_02150 [Candidatus Paceibacterota bacterium]|jgi:hypothetical protein
MHIKTDLKKKVIDIHIEKWDREALPVNLIKEILDHRGCSEEFFINFAFTNKLFLYTKMFFVLRYNKTALYVWTNSPVYGKEYEESLSSSLNIAMGAKPQWAFFAAVVKSHPEKAFVTTADKWLSKKFQENKRSLQVITIINDHKNPEEIIECFNLFNITRNKQDGVLITYPNKNKTESVRYKTYREASIIGFSLKGVIRLLNPVDILNNKVNFLEDYVSVAAVPTDNENQMRVMETAMNYMQQQYMRQQKNRSIDNSQKAVSKWFDTSKYNKFGWILFIILVILFIYFLNSSSETPPVKTFVSESEIQKNSLPTGSKLTISNPGHFRGLGELHITNNGDLDATAKLIRKNKTVAWIYIKAGQNYTFTDISEGIYDLIFSAGLDWNENFKTFNRNKSYQKFDEPFEFSTNTFYEDNFKKTSYSTYSVTLSPVSEGKAKTEYLNESEFFQY